MLSEMSSDYLLKARSVNRSLRLSCQVVILILRVILEICEKNLQLFRLSHLGYNWKLAVPLWLDC